MQIEGRGLGRRRRAGGRGGTAGAVGRASGMGGGDISGAAILVVQAPGEQRGWGPGPEAVQLLLSHIFYCTRFSSHVK